MKNTKRTFKVGLALAMAAAVIILSGCATAEKPNYRGHKGVSPTVYDYYPNTSQR
jgi:hypothetical protein